MRDMSRSFGLVDWLMFGGRAVFIKIARISFIVGVFLLGLLTLTPSLQAQDNHFDRETPLSLGA